MPAMFALTFFGVLHVPINIPALGLTTGEDNVDIDRELRAHGISNALAGFCGSIQVCIQPRQGKKSYMKFHRTISFTRTRCYLSEAAVTAELQA